MHGSQVRGEVFISMDDGVRGNVLLAVRLPECIELRAHVAPLIVCMLMARRHLLDCVYVHVDVCGRVRRVEHLAEGQDEAACRVLGGGGVTRQENSNVHNPSVFSSAHNLV